jgi:uncharacterized phiE125 gp8 family phage protein
MIKCVKPSAMLAVALQDIKSSLRLDTSADDALLAGWIRAAVGQAEDYLGYPLLTAEFEQYFHNERSALLLDKNPVREVLAVVQDTIALLANEYEREDNKGMTRISIAQYGAKISVRYIAGVYAEPNEIPESIRAGISRQVVHLYTHRDAPDIAAFPNAVLALWQPYRQMRVN